jgi:anaerobic selenocysteine-containing dehydrogenase
MGLGKDLVFSIMNNERPPGSLMALLPRWALILAPIIEYDSFGFGELTDPPCVPFPRGQRSKRSHYEVKEMEDSKLKWIATDCTICYHSCGMNVLVEGGRITKVKGLKDHPLNKGRLCPKGARAIELVYHPDRLKYPLKKVNGGWKRVSWEIALTEIADKLQSLKKEFGPEILSIFSGSIGVENLEMMELAQRFKGAFGSPNFISVEGICYRMRIRARQMTFGKYPVEEMNT